MEQQEKGGKEPVRLTDLDVRRLLEDPAPEVRAETAEKIAAEFGAGALGERERSLAEEIFRIMARDVEERVREALAKSLNTVPDLPHDVAKTLAQDVSDSVALPMLAASEVLTDEDLIEIVRSGRSTRQAAIAQRSTVSSEVSDALVEAGSEEVVAVLVANEGADLAEQTLHKVVERYGESERVQEPLVHRSRLPITVAERLVAKLTDDLKTYLVTHHELPAAVASDLVLQSRERATIGLLSDENHEPDVEELVRQMEAHGRLTASVVLRALCTGDLTFFEAALAVKADVPLVNARILIHDEGPLGLKSIYEKAGLPERLFPVFRAAFDIAREYERQRSDDDPERRNRLILERMLTQFEDPGEEFDVEDIDYLLGRLVRSQVRDRDQDQNQNDAAS